MLYRRFFDFPVARSRNPFAEIERMKRQFSDLFETLSEGFLPFARPGVFPLVNLTEDADNYYLRAELPGVDPSDLDIQANRNSISLTGKRQTAPGEGNVKYHRKERDEGSFSRAISLPAEIDVNKINASLKNGILKITIPKAEAAKPRQITIQ